MLMYERRAKEGQGERDRWERFRAVCSQDAGKARPMGSSGGVERTPKERKRERTRVVETISHGHARQRRILQLAKGFAVQELQNRRRQLEGWRVLPCTDLDDGGVVVVVVVVMLTMTLC